MKDSKLLLVLLSTFLLSACGGDSSPSSEPSNTQTPTPVSATPIIDIATSENTSPVLSQTGGSAKLTFKASSDWSATCSESWINLSQESGKAGNVTITISASDNDTYDERKGTVTISIGSVSKTINVSQVQKDAIVLAKEEHIITYNTQTIDFEIQTNVEIQVSISDDAKSWISQANTRALQTVALHFDIAKNVNDDERIGIITIQGGEIVQKITIKQSYDFSTTERNALIELFKATDGTNWRENINWCSDLPVSLWGGVGVNSIGQVISLHLGYNNVSGTIPESISKLTKLENLYIYENNISGLPLSLGSLSELKNLDIGGNPIDKIPESIGDLTNLNVLRAYGCLLTIIPNSIGNLTELKHLMLKNNQISVLPESLGDLKNLISLELSYNKLLTLPESIGNLDKLETLGLGDNKLSELPESLGKLYNLKSLYAFCNNLLHLPSSLNNNTSLEELIMFHNKISYLPDNLRNLKKLEIIDLSNNCINELPNDIGNLSNIKELYLEVNKIKELPESILSLNSLVVLQLGGNEISSLPKNYVDMSNLKEFYLNHNHIEGQLPTWFKELKNLAKLNMQLNHLDKIQGETHMLLKTKLGWQGYTYDPQYYKGGDPNKKEDQYKLDSNTN